MITKEQWLNLVSKVDQTFEDEFKAEYNSPELMFPLIQWLLKQCNISGSVLLKQLIDFNDKLIAEHGNEMTAYEIHQKVIRKAAELLEQEKETLINHNTATDGKPVVVGSASITEDQIKEIGFQLTDSYDH